MISAWLGCSVAGRSVWWLAIGIWLGYTLDLPPYLTFSLAAACWICFLLGMGLRCFRQESLGVRPRRMAVAGGRPRCSGGVRLLWVRRMRQKVDWGPVVLLVIAGAASFSVRVMAVTEALKPLIELNQEVPVVARVVESPWPRQGGGRYFTVEVVGALFPDGARAVKGRVRVTQECGPGQIPVPLACGDWVCFAARFRQPRQAGNPGQFSYRHYLYRHGISATAYLGERQTLKIIQWEVPISARLRLLRFSDRLRCRLLGTWQHNLSGPAFNLMAAMVLGERQKLEPELQQAFRRTGLGHIFAVSGLHVGFVAATASGLITHLHLSAVLGSFLAIAAVWIYALMVGLGPSVMRAASTITLYFLARNLRRQAGGREAVVWAALIQLLINPLLLFDVGFQLSYAAILGIIRLFPLLRDWAGQHRHPGLMSDFYRNRLVSRGCDLLLVGTSAQFGIFPLLIHYFTEFSLLGVVAGLVVVPVAGLVVQLTLAGALCNLIFPVLGSMLAPILELLLAFLSRTVTMLAAWPVTTIYLPSPGAGGVICYYFFLDLAAGCLQQQTLHCDLGLPANARLTRLYNREADDIKLKVSIEFYLKCRMSTRPRRETSNVPVFCCLLLLLLVFYWVIWYPSIASLWRPVDITFLDVGQGDAIFVAVPNGRAVLIDGGGLPAGLRDGSFDVGEDIVVPFLRRRGVRHLDLVMATHFHADHCQGLMAVLRSFPVSRVADNGMLDNSFTSWEYVNTLLRLQQEGRSFERWTLHRGHRIRLSPSVELVVLHPPPPSPGLLYQHDPDDIGTSPGRFLPDQAHRSVGDGIRSFSNTSFGLVPGEEGTEGVVDGTIPLAGNLHPELDQNNGSVVVKLVTPFYSVLLTGDIERESKVELITADARLKRLVENGAGDSIRRLSLRSEVLKVAHHGARDSLFFPFLQAVQPRQAIISVGSNSFGQPAPSVLDALESVTGHPPWRTDRDGSIRLQIWGKHYRYQVFRSQSLRSLAGWPRIQRWESAVRKMMTSWGRVQLLHLELIR